MLAPVLLFLGYSLIYASVAGGGKYATDPWNGLFSDAYVDLGGAATGSAAGAALGTLPGAATPGNPNTNPITGQTVTGNAQPKPNVAPIPSGSSSPRTGQIAPIPGSFSRPRKGQIITIGGASYTTDSTGKLIG